jgi:prophage antirepressor-like protein
MNPFEHDKFGKIRVVMVDDEPWFYAVDVARGLGYTTPQNAIARHCENPKTLVIPNAHPMGGAAPPKIISKRDVQRLLIRSNKPKARPFLDWVLDDIFPSLEKTGKYEIEGHPALPPKEEPAQPLPPMTDNFFVDALQVFRQAKEFCRELGFNETDAGLRAIKAIRNRYGIDLAELTGGTALISSKQPKQLESAPSAGGTKMYTATELGQLLDPEWSGKNINIELKRAKFISKESYIGKGGVKKSRWRISGEGLSYGEEIAIGGKHTDGLPKFTMKWYPNVMDFIADGVARAA